MKYLLLLFSLSSAAQAETPIICRAGQSFYKEIYNCGKNTLAVTYAKQCSETLFSDAKSHGRALVKNLAKLKSAKESSQTESMGAAKVDLIASVESLEEQIKSLQANTNVIADYPLVMIDYADGEDETTSAICFSDSFDDLQEIVAGLDKEIVNAKRARQEALEFLKTLQISSRNLDSMNTGRVPSSVESKGQGPAAGPKGKRIRGSDISGTEKKKKK